MYSYTSFQLILKLFTSSHECNNYNLYKRGSTVQKHAKGHHFERSYRPNDAKLKGDFEFGNLLMAAKVRKKFEMVVPETLVRLGQIVPHVNVHVDKIYMT